MQEQCSSLGQRATRINGRSRGRGRGEMDRGAIMSVSWTASSGWQARRKPVGPSSPSQRQSAGPSSLRSTFGSALSRYSSFQTPWTAAALDS